MYCRKHGASLEGTGVKCAFVSDPAKVVLRLVVIQQANVQCDAYLDLERATASFGTGRVREFARSFEGCGRGLASEPKATFGVSNRS